VDYENNHEQKKTWSIRTLAWLFIGSILAGYLVVIPSITAFLAQFQEQPVIMAATELDVYELFRFRTAKFLVFSIFTYYGACVASFINVVAKSVPSGASVTTRSSACPACGTPIRRIDNLPLISYLNLGGRCRNCLSAIPVRYFLTELIGATIFGSLFLFELVTGAANVPEFKHYFYTGILWIILYTKWPVVGIYLYHVALFSCLLMLSLMDIDRLRCPKWLAGIMLFTFAGLSIGIPTLQPIKSYDHLPDYFQEALPASIIPVVTCVAGGFIGWFLTSIIHYLYSRRKPKPLSSSTFSLAGTLVGIVLGWQATVTICLFTIVVLAAMYGIERMLKKRLLVPETVTFSVVAFLHHPFWRWLDGFW
jgi:leader peptidase (prepilin peptidase)/N-methyltransferase